MKHLKSNLVIALLMGASLNAQAEAGRPVDANHPVDCAKSSNPEQCKVWQNARQACEGKQKWVEQRNCIRDFMKEKGINKPK